MVAANDSTTYLDKYIEGPKKVREEIDGRGKTASSLLPVPFFEPEEMLSPEAKAVL